MKVTKSTYAKVMERDNGTCQLCGSTSWVIAHHIMYLSMSGNSEKENLIVLCTSCHTTKVHANGKMYFPILLEIQRVHYPSLTKQDLKLKNKWITKGEVK